MAWNRHNFTPDDSPALSTYLNAEFDAAKANSSSGAGGGIPGLTGNGRIVTTEAQAANSAQFLPPTPALAFTLPAGFIWIQDGAVFEVEEEIVLTDLPAVFEGFIALHAEYDDEGDFIDWTFTTSETRGVLGIGTLAYVETDADTVILLDASDAQSDVILALPILAARQRNLLARLTALESGGGSGGGAAYTGLGLWLPTPGDSRETAIVIQEKFDAQRAELTELIEAGGERESPTETDEIWKWLLGIRGIIGMVFPNLLRFLPGGGAQPGLHGVASAPDTIRYDVGGTLPEVTSEREWDSR